VEDKEYFRKIRANYLKASAYSSELYQATSTRLNRILFGTVVDFGNGGIINYDTKRLKQVICVDIINEEAKLSNGKVDFVYGDFYQGSPCKADCVLAQYLFHHLTDDEGLREGIKKVKTMLNEKGKMVVLEVALPEWAENIQNRVRPVFLALLSALGKPGLRFFSAKSLVNLLRECGFRRIQEERISVGRRVSPAPVLFPDLRIDGKLYPFKCILIVASG